MKKYTEGEVLKALRERVDRGTQKEVASKLGFTPQFINDVIGGRRNVTEALAGSLGFERVSFFVRKRGDEQPTNSL